ncbi:3D domain-containing protein [Neobacillus mesonae]|uniref:3D domain-containing protein n=1 Tax=Neobacillus mesonae TaxID=1193713 RepID=UPI001FD608F8|nr:3D domain-containing protein [Neobacillus mesonae]
MQLNEQRELNKRLRAEIKRLEAKQWRDFTATAYTADCPEGCTGITKTGVDVRNQTHVNGRRVVATDPAVIPLGTVIEIRFADGRLERAIALDTGGAIRGNIIDYLVSDNATAVQFGRQRVKIRIIGEAK